MAIGQRSESAARTDQSPSARPAKAINTALTSVAISSLSHASASRAYEANLSFAKDARELALKTLEIGK